MEIIKGRVTYKDTYDNLIDKNGYVTCGCDAPQVQAVKSKETAKKYIVTYVCNHCYNKITAELDRRKGKKSGKV